MSEKKNIDRLFQEKFKDFEVAPPERLWQNIEAELQKEKRERRVIPIWFRLGGVAAILVMGLMLTMPFFSDFDGNNSNPVVIDNNESGTGKKLEPTYFPVKPNSTVTNADSGTRPGPDRENTAVAAGSERADDAESGVTAPAGTVKAAGSKTGVAHSNNAVAYGERQYKNNGKANTGKNKIGKEKNYRNISTHNNSAVAHQSDKTTNNKKGNTDSNRRVATGITTGDAGNSNNAVAGNGRDASVQNQNRNVQRTANPGALDSSIKNQSATGIAGIGTAGEEQPGNNLKLDNDGVIAGESTETAIAETAVDTAATAQPENELEKLLQDKLNGKDTEEKAVAEANINKWNIKPQLAPVFYNSLSQGSPIDAQFAGNSKEYDNDLSYGIGVNYALSNKITLRTGVNTVNLSYATNGVQFYAALDEQTPNIAARGNANIVVKSNTGPAVTSVEGLPTPTVDGSLVQKMGYIEVPLEMSYKLVDKKFGIDVIGGVSTLFLNENNVHVRTIQGYTSNIGEAQNLNNIHFSTNIGLGFKYSFWKAFEANFEPMFKYQVNTFSSDSGNFKPYFIGLYSGISFSF